MKHFPQVLAFSFLMGTGLIAAAQQLFPADLTLSWTNATEYEDGTLLAEGDLVSVRIECYRNNDPLPTVNQTFTITGLGLQQTETMVGVIPNPGSYACIGFSILFDGTQSVASNTVTKKYTGRPKPPVVF